MSAYKQFAVCHLRPVETVDIFFAELHKLAIQFQSGIWSLRSLLEHVEKLLQATGRRLADI